LVASWLKNREEYFSEAPGAAAYLLGSGTREVYLWVRKSLEIPMRKGIDIDVEELDKQTSRIYKALVTGDVNDVLLKALAAADP
jgi:hypothetical protein